jgi:virulence-associated protein VagC
VLVAAVTKLFLSNRSQAVRIISPVGKRWDSFFHDNSAVPDDFLPERAMQEQPDREPFRDQPCCAICSIPLSAST